VKAWEEFTGSPETAKGVDYTYARFAAKRMRKNNRGNRAWRSTPQLDMSSARRSHSVSPCAGEAVEVIERPCQRLDANVLHGGGARSYQRWLMEKAMLVQAEKERFRRLKVNDFCVLGLA
jgi:hypothetical protein